MESTFMYEIRPRRRIPIPGQLPITHPCSKLLTKDQVMEYMKFGNIYRKLPNGRMELVTGQNINKLHRDPRKVEEELTKPKSVEAKNIPHSPEIETVEKPEMNRGKSVVNNNPTEVQNNYSNFNSSQESQDISNNGQNKSHGYVNTNGKKQNKK